MIYNITNRKPILNKRNDEKLIIYSDDISNRFVERFARKHFFRVYSRKTFLFLHPFIISDGKLPYFLSDANIFHHHDIRNVEKTRKKKNVKKEDLSLIIFDSHTDMYQCGKCSPIEEKINMENWVSCILTKGYSNISLVGVTDFTLTCPQREGFEYTKFKDRVSFFLGKNYKPEQDFKEHNPNELQLHNQEDFYSWNIRPYSFISLDSDVSSEFTRMNQKFAGRLGSMTVEELSGMIKYVNENSELIGFSFYANGLGDAFLEKSENLLNILNF